MASVSSIRGHQLPVKHKEFKSQLAVSVIVDSAFQFLSDFYTAIC